MEVTSALCRCLSSCCADFCLTRSPLVGVEFSFGLSLRQAGSMVTSNQPASDVYIFDGLSLTLNNL